MGIICGVWSVAFGLKFLGFFLGKNLYTADTDADPAYSTALLLAVEDFLTIVIPIFLVVEKDFVSVMASEFLEKYKQVAVENQLVTIINPSNH